MTRASLFPAARLAAGLAGTTAVALVLAVVGQSAMADTTPNAVSKYVEEARQYLSKGDLKSAEIQLKNALRDNADDNEARYELGIVYLREGQPAAAESAFTTLMQKGVHDDRVMPALGQALLAEAKAKELLERLPVQAPSTPEGARVDVLRVRALLAQRRLDEANAELKSVLAAKPDLPEALLAQADILRLNKDFTGESAAVDKVLAANPNNVLALSDKGDLLRMQGQNEQAVEEYKKALAIEPRDIAAQLGRAAAFLVLKRKDDAKLDIDAVLQRVPTQPLALFLRASMFFEDGKVNEALSALRPAEAQLADVSQAQILLAQLNLRTNNIELGLQHAQQAYTLDPSSAQALRLLALAYSQKRDARKVVDLLEPYVAQHADDAGAQILLGDAYSAMGRYQDANKALEAASQHRPDDVDLRTRIDANRLQSGDTSDAMKDLAAITETKPEAGNASVLLITTNMALGRLDEAAKYAELFRKNEPKNPVADNLLGLIHQGQGDRDTAKKDFQDALEKDPTFFPAASSLAKMDEADGKVDEARDVYQSVLKADPRNAGVFLALSDLAGNSGDPDGAVAWMEKAVAASPQSPLPQIGLIDLLLAQGKVEKALSTASVASSTFPDNVDILVPLARAEIRAGHTDDGVGTLHHIASLTANSADAQFRLGATLAGLKRPDEATAAYMAAVKLNPKFLPAWQAMAMAQLPSGLDKALAIADQAAQQSGEKALGDLIKANLYVAAKKYDEADALYASILAQHPDGGVLISRSQARLLAGDKEGSRKLLADWLAAHPNDVQVHRDYAAVMMAAKDYDGAIKEYETLLKTSPNNVAMLNNLAWLYGKTNNPKAIDLARHAHDLVPYQPSVDDTLGWLLLQQGKVQPALDLLTFAHSHEPGGASIAYHLAAALAQKGDTAQAIAVLKPLIEAGTAFDEQPDAKALYAKLGGKT